MQRPREIFLILGESNAKATGWHGAGHATGAGSGRVGQTGQCYESFKGTPKGLCRGATETGLLSETPPGPGSKGRWSKPLCGGLSP